MSGAAIPHYPGRVPIDAYGNGGFRFAGMSHVGSILCLPSGIYAWPVVQMADVAIACLEPAFAEKDGIGVFLLGTGRTQVFPGAALSMTCAEGGLGLEAMDTGAACRTYNVLLGEGRPVAAALIAVG